MRKFVLSLIFIAFIACFVSCMRGITPEQAANGKAKCGRNYIR